jgi:hypothetical protein
LCWLPQEGSLECYLVECGVPPDDVDRVVTQVGGGLLLLLLLWWRQQRWRWWQYSRWQQWQY